MNFFEEKMKIIILILSFILIISCGDENNNHPNNTVNGNLEINSDIGNTQPQGTLKITLNQLPDWLKMKFLYKINTLEPLSEDEYPENIQIYPPENVKDPKNYFTNLPLELDSKILDEVAFQIATTPNNILTDFNFRIELFKENTLSIYNIAKELEYVDIIEKENFTTLKYKLQDKDGNTYEYELPYYYYYNYVLPLIIDDNSAFYINPKTGKFSEKGNSDNKGKMWRDYIYNHAKENRPALKDLLKNQKVLWKNKSNYWGHYDTQKWNHGYKDSEITQENQVQKVDEFLNEAYHDQGAIGSVIEWMMKNMIFGAKIKRPIEPVEIFAWGRGNCGEWGDLTTATLRTALIPATVVSTSIDDHVWNEFYDGKWHNIEPYHPFVDYQFYDKDIASEIEDINGFGWQAHITARARHDGLMEDVIDRYSDYGTLKVSVKDKNGNPLDDSIIVIYGQGDLRPEGELSLGLVTYTDIFGNAEINLGDNRGFWGVVFTPLGSFPIEENEVEKIMDNVTANKTYEWNITIDNEKKYPKYRKVEANGELTLKYNLKNLESYSIGYNIWHSSTFLKKDKKTLKSPVILITDRENYNKFKEDKYADIDVLYSSNNQNGEIKLPIDKELYFIINNDTLRTVYQTDLDLNFYLNGQKINEFKSKIFLFSSYVTEFSLKK